MSAKTRKKLLTFGGILGKVSKIAKTPFKFLKSKTVDKIVDGSLGKIKDKVYKIAKLQGRNSWESLTKQVYTKLRNGTWKKISKKTLAKMFGFEVIDSVSEETIKQMKQMLEKLIPEIDISLLTKESINYLKKLTEEITPKQLGELLDCGI